ncbi:hypothetical protein F5Y10DRAFT_188153 [Nemania abortiva]|nr:hypothetical protein F5Y10DRAFT_188153 [Nemania abortiva]
MILLTVEQQRHCLFLGCPSTIALFDLPQMFQLVYGLSGVDAGVRVIAFSATMSVGTAVAVTATGRLKVNPDFMLLLGSVLRIIRFSLMSRIPVSLHVPPELYGLEVVSGLGFGINFTLMYLLMPFQITARDKLQS